MKDKKKEGEGKREDLPFAVSLPRYFQQQVWARPKPPAWSSTQVIHRRQGLRHHPAASHVALEEAKSGEDQFFNPWIPM